MKFKWFISLAFMIAAMSWVSWQGKELKMPGTPWGIVSLELAYTPGNASETISSWKTNHLSTVALINIYIDFVFIIAYCLFLYLCVQALSLKHKKKLRAAGNLIAKGMVAAGCFDMAENVFMLFMLNGSVNTVTAGLTGIFAGLKFLMIIMALLYIICSGIYFLIRRR